jgi:hypothetical protein
MIFTRKSGCQKSNGYAMAMEPRSPSTRTFSTPEQPYVLDTPMHQSDVLDDFLAIGHEKKQS